MKKLITIVFAALCGATAQAGLYDAWNYQAQIQFGGYNKAETLTNFPALVVLGTNISNFAYSQFLSGTNDLAFTDATGLTNLNYEIDKWNTNGLSCVWVQVPALASNSTITAWWGASGQTQPVCTTNGATWTNGFAGVWHLTESSGLHADSTAGKNSGTCNGTITRGATGMVDGADQFGGGYVEIANQSYFNYERTSAFTFEAWVKVTTPNAYNFVLCKELNSGTYTGPYLGISTDNRVFMNLQYSAYYTGLEGARNVADGVWHHIAGVNIAANGGSAADIRLYVDGALEILTTNSNTLGANSIQNTTPVTIGSRAGGGCPFTGIIDEPRVSTVARSANWVWAVYMNMASNATAFQTYGVATAGGGATTPGFDGNLWLWKNAQF
jgi:hypothetical protein